MVGIRRRSRQAGRRRVCRRASDQRTRLLRARTAEYYRQSFFWHRDDLDGKELTTAYAASVKAFRAALPLLDVQAHVLEGETPGYLYVPRGDGPFPTILHIGGYDGTAEELYSSAYMAVDRGYAFATLDGPGTGSPLYDHGVPMRPDWEHIVPGMVDLILTRPEVDPQRIVLTGRSFGGLTAPRGASGEPRLAAMIADPGQYDIGAGVAERFGDLYKTVDDPASDPQWNALLDNPALKAFFAPRMVTHGVSSPREYVQRPAALQQHRSGAEDHLPELHRRQRDRCRLHRPGSGAVRPPHLSQDLPALHCRPKARRVTARAWPRSCSGPRPSTGSTTRSADQRRDAQTSSPSSSSSGQQSQQNSCPRASRAPFHVAAEVVEAAGAHAAVVASQRGVALRTGWAVGEAFVTLACELDEPSAAGSGEEHLPVAIVTHHHGASMTPGCDRQGGRARPHTPGDARHDGDGRPERARCVPRRRWRRHRLELHPRSSGAGGRVGRRAARDRRDPTP